jgi:hypothetical protein
MPLKKFINHAMWVTLTIGLILITLNIIYLLASSA